MTAHESHGFLGSLVHAVMITGFVFVMMMVVEYLNVLTRGALSGKLAERKWRQYFLAALLGVMPGCLGSFAVVSMYIHGVMTFGALVAAMIATVGDEAFFMLAVLPPWQTVIILIALTIMGVVAGAIIDRLKCVGPMPAVDKEMKIHVEEEKCCCFTGRAILQQWKECSAQRGILTVLLLGFIIAILTGNLGMHEAWATSTVLLVSLAALFVVVSVSDHFLESHLWEHVARKHVPKIFLWSFSILLVISYLHEHLEMVRMSGMGNWLMLIAACLIGLVPQSGPHMLFIVLYSSGNVPLGILLANSIVQDGHGMIPVLAYSRKVFFRVKLLKLCLGFGVGAVFLLF